jgi:predicted ATPase
MRIYLTGAHGIGKTTVARYIAEKYKLILIPEAARLILSEQELQLSSLRSDINVVNKYQIDVFNRQLQEESGKDNFVADRSIIDNLAYSAQHTDILNLSLKDKRIKQYLEKLKLNDTIMFFVRPDKNMLLIEDGVRERPTWESVISIDSTIKTFLELFDIRYFQINTDNMAERIRLVDSVLSLAK